MNTIHGIIPKPKRQFLGKTSDFKNKEERMFNQRMLKAYLQGKSDFIYGIDHNGLPKSFEVLQTPKQKPFEVVGNGIAKQSRYPLYTRSFYGRCGKNMTK